LEPVHRFLVRRAAVTLVTATFWVDTVHEWGGRGLVVHEAPGQWASLKTPAPHPGRRPKILLVSRFAGDEPVDEAVTAARLVPEFDLLVTGRLEDLPAALAADAAPNVSFVGFLPQGDYAALVAEADLVVALTTEPTSVMRCAYEAVYARKPLVISDWPLCRELFPFALPVANNSEAIATGLKAAIARLAELEGEADEALSVQMARWDSQLAALISALGLTQSQVEPLLPTD
jgi:glycosyltransferase involved in cell wall biosynthesis